MSGRNYGERFDPRNAAPRFVAEHSDRYRYASRYIPTGRILDAGAGTGHGTQLIAGSGHSVVALEIDEKAAARARQLSDVVCVRGDVTLMPFMDEAFDGTIALEVLEHISDQERFIAELARTLRIGGVIVLSTPNRLSRAIPHDNPFHVRELAPAELTSLLTSRFEIVRRAGQYLERRNILDAVRAWIAASGQAEALRGFLPARLRRAGGHVAFGSSAVVDLADYEDVQPATLVVVAIRR